MATAERDYYELLGVARGATDAEIKKAFRKLARELHPDVSEEADAQERFREVAEAYEVLSNAETRAALRPLRPRGLRRGGFTPADFDLGNLSDIFSAFFGDDLFGARPRRPRARRRLGLAVEIELADAFAGVTRAVEVEVAVTCGRCDGDGAEPGTDASPARRAAGTGGCSRSRAASSASSSAPRPARRAPARAASSRPVPALRRGRAHARGEPSSRSRSRPGSTTASGSASAARATPARAAAARATPTSRCASRATSASCARATTSSRRST